MKYHFFVQDNTLQVEPMMYREDLLELTPAELHAVVVAKWCCLCAYHARFPKASRPEGVGAYTCAYCVVHLVRRYGYCETCPIRLATDQTECDGTPFRDYLGGEPLLGSARAELAFLIDMEV